MTLLCNPGGRFGFKITLLCGCNFDGSELFEIHIINLKTKTVVTGYGFTFQFKVAISDCGFSFNCKTVVSDYDFKTFKI